MNSSPRSTVLTRFRRGAILAASVFLFLIGAASANAEDWELVRTIPGIDSSADIHAVGPDGTVVGTRSFGQTIHRWPATGGEQTIGTAPNSCFLSGAGVSAGGVILGSQQCMNLGGVTWQGLAWGPESTVPSTSNMPAGLRINAVNPEGKFIGTNFYDNYDRMDDQIVTGVASIDPQTGTLLVGTTNAGAGFGLDISNDGSIFYGTPQSPTGVLPDKFFRDGGPSGPMMVRASETYETSFGFLPDEKVLARVAGPSTDPDPATDENAMKIVAYDGVTPFDVPMSGGGLSAKPMQQLIPGGGDQAFFGTATGTSAPPGQAVIVSWFGYGQGPHALPIYHDLNPGDQSPTVRPAAASRDGAWLALDNGELWRDLDANAPLPPGAICIPGASKGDLNACVLRGKATPRLKKIAEQQSAVYNSQLSGFAKAFGKLSLIEAGATTEELETVVGSAGAGLSARIVSAINARNYWQTVAQDPPDPKYKQTATPRKVNTKPLKKVPGLSRKQAKAFSAWVAAQLRLASATACGIEAINRGATAYDAGDARSAINQYRAGDRCAKLAGAEAKKVAKTGPAAAKAISALTSRAKKKGAAKVKKKPSKKAIAKAVGVQVGKTSKLLKLTAAEKKALKAALTPKKSAKPGLPNLAGLIKKDAKKVGSDSAGLGQSGGFMTGSILSR